LSVAVLNEERRGAIFDAVRGDPAVAAVAATWPGALGGMVGLPAYGEGASGRSVVSYQFVSPELFGVLGIELARGRSFTEAERNPNEGIVIASEAAARELWPGSDPLGQVLRLQPDGTIGRPASAPPVQ